MRDDLWSDVAELGRKINGDKAAVWMRDMQRFLRDGEQPLALVRVGGMSIDLILATNDRVTGWSSAAVSKGPKLAVLWSDVVEYRYVGMTEKLLVRRVAGDEVTFGPVHKDDRPMVDQLFRQHRPATATQAASSTSSTATGPAPVAGEPLTATASSTSPVGEEPAASTAWIDELTRLGELFERGLLDEREFRLAKQKLLRSGG